MSSSPPREGHKVRRNRKLRRRFAGGMALLLGLVAAGFLAAALTPSPQVASAEDDMTAQVKEGKALYETSCITCHGANLQGVNDRGPSLIGVGEAAVYFQVSTGRMPMAANTAQAKRKPAKFDADEVDAIGAYVEANGGGPEIPRDKNGNIDEAWFRGSHEVGASQPSGSIARGSELFRQNCASCHNFTGKGGALSSGKWAPALVKPSSSQIYAAMLTGPQNMPKFSDRQLTPNEKRDVIAYIKNATEVQQPGGYGLGGFGPATEGLAAFAIGMVAVVGAALWIGSRS
ncbi:MAG: cytochrome c [Nocardiaceae bacterium]|nr:cytochrome c [Nocardiaceae bacterium]